MSVDKLNKALDLFWSKVVLGYSHTSCWIYTGSKTHNGYGNVKLYVDKKIHYYRAHRLVYELMNGIIPDNKVVMHKCDNRACVNPNHLVLGSVKDNVRDCINKNRFPWNNLEKNKFKTKNV